MSTPRGCPAHRSMGLTVDCQRLATSKKGEDPESLLRVLSWEGGGESETKLALFHLPPRGIEPGQDASGSWELEKAPNSATPSPPGSSKIALLQG